MAKNFALLFGLVFVVVGILGFVGGLGIVGPTGFFVTDTAHDLVHLLSGIVLVLVSVAAPSKSKSALVVFGIVYLLVTVLGFMSASGSILGLLAINTADNYLHLVLGLALLLAGLSKNVSAQILQPSQPMM
jgi:hypothetical protein